VCTIFFVSVFWVSYFCSSVFFFLFSLPVFSFFPLGVPLVFLLPAFFFFTFMGSFISFDFSPSLYCVLFRSLCLRSRDESKAGNAGFLLFPFLSLCFRSSVSWVFFFCVLAFFSGFSSPFQSKSPSLFVAIPSPFIRSKLVVTTNLLNAL